MTSIPVRPPCLYLLRSTRCHPCSRLSRRWLCLLRLRLSCCAEDYAPKLAPRLPPSTVLSSSVARPARLMSGTLSLQLPGNRREVVKTTPTTTLGAVLAEACARGPRPLGDPASYLLMQGKATLDLSLSLRFAGVASGARLEVVKKQALGAPCAVEPPAAVPAAATSKRVHPATHDAPEVGAQPQVPPEEVRGCVAEPTACAMAPGCAPAAPHGADDAAVHAAQALAARRQAACALAGRAVRVYSRDALLAAGQQPPEELPEAFYECVRAESGGAAAALWVRERRTLTAFSSLCPAHTGSRPKTITSSPGARRRRC